MGDLIFVFDYDGTLARENEPVEEGVAGALARLKAAHSLRFVLATARPLADVERFVPVDLFDGMILELGAVVFLQREIAVFKPVGWGALISEVAARVPAVNRGEVLYYFDEEDLPGAKAAFEELRAERLAEIRKVGSRTHVFAPKRLDKSVGLSRLLALTGWPGGFIVAVGDSKSDIPLFRAAHFKVAVANAEEAVKREADLVVSKQHGEGAVEAVEKVLEKVGSRKI